MYEFKYHRPATLEEASDIHASAVDAQYIAGGQSLLPSLKFRLSRPSDVIDLSHVPDLDFIRTEDDALSIGSATPHVALGGSATSGRTTARAEPYLKPPAAFSPWRACRAAIASIAAMSPLPPCPAGGTIVLCAGDPGTVQRS